MHEGGAKVVPAPSFAAARYLHGTYVLSSLHTVHHLYYNFSLQYISESRRWEPVPIESHKIPIGLRGTPILIRELSSSHW